MSKDIRSYFQLKKPAKPKVEDDTDIIPESPDVHIKTKKKESRKRVILDDSDDESSKPKKQNDNSKTKSSKNKKIEKPTLKEVKATDIFGSAPIKRTEPLVKKLKKKTETGIHSDEEFEKSLLEIDAGPDSISKQVKEESETKNQNQNSKKKTEEITLTKEGRSEDALKEKEQNNDVTIKEEVKKDVLKSESKAMKNGDIQKNNRLFNSAEKKIKRSKNDFSEFLESDDKESGNHEKKKENHKKNSLDNKVDNSDNSIKSERKRDFDEYAGNESQVEDNDDKHKSKKRRLNTSLNDSVLTDEERHERRMQSAALYKNYLNRSGPKHLGAKVIPEGSPDCLQHCAFLLTGVLDSFEREEIADAIAKFGGCIKNSISKKVTHVLAGEEAGPAKMAKAQELGIKILNEDQFLQLIVDSSSKSNKSDVKNKKDRNRDETSSRDKKKSRSRDRKVSKEKGKSPYKEKTIEKDNEKSLHKDKNSLKDKEKSPNKDKRNHIGDRDKVKSEEIVEPKIKSNKNENNDLKLEKEIIKVTESDKQEIKDIKSESSQQTPSRAVPSSMWVEKYKPQTVKQIIGQHGDASNVKKLMNWLTKWYVNRKAKLPKPSPWAKNDDGGYYKAALLSGPPGVGKTTTVALVCKELGFDVVEFNASDTRNKTLIKEQIGELLTTTSLSAYAKGDVGKQAVTKKHVLVMDEVDGMAGNEDRGGMQELIGLIKSSSVPIICMCNDRNSQKMRSLVNYCYDLKFSRPRVEQIKSAMMSICCKEGIKIPPDALTQLIVAANQDVRQTLNFLSLWAVDSSLADSDRLKADARNIRKDIKLGPWESVRKVFSAEDHKTMSLMDKSDLFFYDYSMAPLFVQENYLLVQPHCPKNEVLDRLSKAADSISAGDLVDARIRRNQAWGLLPIQAMYSSVMPGHQLSGHVAGQIQFPGWLGKNSRASKMHRLCQEIHAHTRLSTSGSKSSIFLDYSSHLRDAILAPLLKDKSEGIDRSLEVLEAYHLLREDLDSLLELSLWPGQRNPMILIDSKVKAAMTRTYNKKSSALPYAPAAARRGRAHDAALEDDDDVIEDEEHDSDPENDALIKKKKSKEDKSSSSQDKASTSKKAKSRKK